MPITMDGSDFINHRDSEMIEVVNFCAPVLELSITEANQTRLVKVYGVLVADDLLLETLQSLVQRHGFAEGLRDWTYLQGVQVLSITDGENEVERIAKQLTGNHPAIYRYLASRSHGVTFTEFTDYRDPVTGNRLTESQDPYNIAAMLRKMNQSLVRFGKKIEAKPSQNLIKLSVRNKSNV
jgi:hypothetical protein